MVNDSVGSSKLDAFKKAFPDRLINVGIAEQDMVGVAAGLANGGRIPFVSAASCFLTGRALEQIKADVAYSNRNVKLCGMSPGMAYGELGPTHHSIEDIAWLRAIDNMIIVVPADPIETAAAHALGRSHRGAGVHPGLPDGGAGGLRRRLRVRPRPGPHPARRRRRHDHQQRHGAVAGPGRRRAARGRRDLGPGDLDADGQAAGRRRRHRGGPRDEGHRHRRGGHHGRQPGRSGGRDRGPAPSHPGDDPRRARVRPDWIRRLPARPLRHVARRHRRGGPDPGNG